MTLQNYHTTSFYFLRRSITIERRRGSINFYQGKWHFLLHANARRIMKRTMKRKRSFHGNPTSFPPTRVKGFRGEPLEWESLLCIMDRRGAVVWPQTKLEQSWGKDCRTLGQIKHGAGFDRLISSPKWLLVPHPARQYQPANPAPSFRSFRSHCPRFTRFFPIFT